MAEQADPRELVELLSVGPNGGLDPTTDPLYVAPNNFPDSSNFIPNADYGGFRLVQGRVNALFGLLPSVPNGMHCLHRQGQPDVYLFAVDVTVLQGGTFTKIGQIYAAQLGQTPQPLSIPQPLTPGQPTKFADAQLWCFVTNGVDRPLKIDTNLNVTYWGIIPPITTPIIANDGPGVLLGTYYYCTTFSGADQESSQGTISPAIIFTSQRATATGTISGHALSGTVLYCTAGNLASGQATTSFTVQPNLDGSIPGVFQMASGLAATINADPVVSQFVTAQAQPPTSLNATAANIMLTAVLPGTQGNASFFQFNKSTDAVNLFVTPQTATLLTGGIDGNTAKLTNLPAQPSDSQVTSLNIYRLGGSLGTWNLITTLTYGPNFPAAYYDFTPDSAVTGQELIVNRDPPPPFQYIAAHQERIFGFGIGVDYNPTPTLSIDADPSVVWWSNVNEPWGFDAANNTFTAGDNQLGDVAAGIMEMGGVLALLKSSRVYWVYGSTDTDFQPIFAFFIGCDAPLSAAVGYGMGFWHSRQGVHYTDGSWYYNISDGAYQQSNVKKILDSLTAADFAASCGFIYDRQYYLSFPTQGFTLLYDLRVKAWYKLAMSTPQAVFNLDIGAPVVAAGELQNQGQILQWFASPTDLGAPIVGTLKTRIVDAVATQARVKLRYGIVEAPVQPGVSLEITTLVDPSTGSQLSDAIQLDLGFGTATQRWSMPVPSGSQLQTQLTITSSTGAIFHKLAVYGWVEALFSPSDEAVPLRAPTASQLLPALTWDGSGTAGLWDDATWS